MSTPDGGQAFPVTGHGDGMTLRDYFAAKALGGMISGFIARGLSWTPAELADECYLMADAMLKARDGAL